MLLYKYNACIWCGLTAHGEMQQVDTANILTPVMAQQEEWCVLVLHKNANPVIFYPSPTCCSIKSNGSLRHNKIYCNKATQKCVTPLKIYDFTL